MWEPFAKALGYPKKKIGFEQLTKLARLEPGLRGVRQARVRQVQARAHQPRLLHLGPVRGGGRVLRGHRQEGGPDREGRRPPRRRASRCATSSARSSTTATPRCSSPTRCAARARATRRRWRWRRSRCSTSTATAAASRKLVALYPPEGTFYSDNPFIVLDAPLGHAAQQREGARGLPGVPGRARSTPERAGAVRLPPGRPEGQARRAGSRRRTAPTPRSPSACSACPSRACSTASSETWREDRKPANVLLVVDTSGSMNDENRLERAKDGLEAFFREVSPNDRRRADDLLRPIQPLVPIGRSANRAELALAGRPA